MSTKSILSILAIAFLLLPAVVFAQADSTKPAAPEEELVETTHTVTIAGAQVKYTAITGTMPLKEDTDDPKASIFFIAYIKSGESRPAERPVTFSFNGGPGSSSVWLHLGVLGPRRVKLEDDGSMPPPPFALVDNEYSLLDKTDLVFIDPVTTGFSRAAKKEDAKEFHGVEGDIKGVGEFIRLFLTKYKRWASPKFLIGESYGTTRAAGLASYLQDRHGMYLNGIMLISSILEFQTARFDSGNDLPYVLFLPTYTATAWYHKQLADDLQADLQGALRESERFAEGDYLKALLQGSELSSDDRTRVVAELARLTGLGEVYVDRSNLRVPIWRFVKELLRDEGRTVGRLDSRFTGIDANKVGDSYEYDPSYAATLGPFSSTFNDYVERELNFESQLPYEILTDKVFPWKMTDENRGGYVNMTRSLREAMTQNPYLKVFVANGYYDLATPYFATEYTFSHLGLDSSLAGNVTMGYYQAGHMMYINTPSLIKLKADLAAFLGAATE